MIASVGAALSVLKVIASQPGVGLSALSRMVGLQKSRVYRILETLAEEGFVYQDASKGYHLGIQAMILGQSARQGTGLVHAAEELINQFAVGYDENIQIRVRDGAENVQIFARKSNQRLRVESAVGNRRPLGQGASGRLLLAYATEQYLSLVGPLAHPMLPEDAAAIRNQGYCCTDGELTTGISAVAVPIFDAEGNCASCLSASVPSARMTESYRVALIQGLQDISRALVNSHL